MDFWLMTSEDSEVSSPHVDTPCLRWRGRLNPIRGYGQVNVSAAHRQDFKHTTIFAHRYAWYLVNGPIPSGAHICHHCDNPQCVRPSHLFLGDAKANIHDAVVKGRMADRERTKHPGASNGRAKLTDTQVQEIREAVDALHRDKRGVRVRRGSIQTLSKRYGVSEMMIHFIGKRKNWKCLPEPQ